MISNLFRAHVTPSDAIGAGLLFFKFSLDHPQSLGPAVTDERRRDSKPTCTSTGR